MEEKAKVWKLLLSILLLLMVFFGGCRYQWQTPFPPSVPKIAIPVFVNETYEYELEKTLTALIREEFFRDGRMEIVEENEANWTLKGKIVDYSGNEPLSEAAGAEEYRVRIVVVISLISEEGEVLERMKDRKIEKTTVYSLVGTIQTEEGAKEETCRKIGQELVNLIWEEWRSK